MSTKLMDPTVSPKTYGSILKSFLNNKNISCYISDQQSALLMLKRKLKFLIPLC